MMDYPGETFRSDGREPRVSGSLSAGLEILCCLADARRSLGLSQIAAQTRQPKATIYRLLRTLRNLGYVTQMTDTRKYALNISIISLAQSIARPFLPPPETLGALQAMARSGGFGLRLDAMIEKGALPIMEITAMGVNFTPAKQQEAVRSITLPLRHPRESIPLRITLSTSPGPEGQRSDSEMETMATTCAEALSNAYWPLLNLTSSH